MAQEIQTVIILGGRGNLGKKLVSVLLRKGFEVTVVTRDASKSFPHDGDETASIVSSDYSLESLVRIFHGQDAVVSTIATENVEMQRTVVDAAIAAGVKRILPTEFGGDTSRDDLAETAPHLQSKKNLIDYIKSRQSNNLSWTALCTSAWYDWMLKQGDGLVGWDIKTRSGTIYGSGNQRLLATNFSRVPEAVAAVLLHFSETRNEYVFISSFELTQNSVWQALEKVTGQTFQIERSDTATLHATAVKHLEQGNWDEAYYGLVTSSVYSGSAIGYFPEKSKRWNRILGLAEEETLENMIERVVAEVDNLDLQD